MQDEAAPIKPGDQPLVSGIIIFLNEEKYLAEAIESVLAQTYKNWELLLVDDGSTDSSGEIARRYAARESDRVRYLTHANGTNRGMSASRNIGLENAHGTYAAFLDADDVWYPDKLERQVMLFNEHPDAVLVIGATLYWHSWDADDPRSDQIVFVGNIPGADGRSASLLDQDRLYPPEALLKQLYPLSQGTTPSSSGMMIRRDVALAVGGFEPSFRGLFEDQVFLARMLLAGPAYVSSFVFDRYRQHKDSCSSMTRDPGERTRLRRAYLAWLKKHLDQIQCRDPMIRSKLRLATLRIDHPRTYGFITRVGRLIRRLLPDGALARGVSE